MSILKDVPAVDVAQIAQVCYEASRAWYASQGMAVPTWAEAPQEDRDSMMEAVLFYSNNPSAGPEARHGSWVERMLKDGWTLGATLDVPNKKHTRLVPFKVLPFVEQLDDILCANIVRALIGFGVRPDCARPSTYIKAGENNDPSVQIGTGGAAVVTNRFWETMLALGFKESEGSFVYNANGRAIWVNPNSPELSEDVTRQIVESAEAVGKRAKINELRKALDLPFGEVDVVSPS